MDFHWCWDVVAKSFPFEHVIFPDEMKWFNLTAHEY